MAKRRKQKAVTLSDQLRLVIASKKESRNSICVEAEIDKGQLSRFMNGTGTLGNETLDRLWPVLKLEIKQK